MDKKYTKISYKHNLVVDSTPELLSNWLNSYLSKEVYGSEHPIEYGEIQIVKPKDGGESLKLIEAEWCWTIPLAEDEYSKPTSTNMGIVFSFQIIQLSSNRIEVVATCFNSNGYSDYFKILNEISKRWPEHIDSPFPYPNEKFQKEREEKIKALKKEYAPEDLKTYYCENRGTILVSHNIPLPWNLLLPTIRQYLPGSAKGFANYKLVDEAPGYHLYLLSQGQPKEEIDYKEGGRLGCIGILEVIKKGDRISELAWKKAPSPTNAEIIQAIRNDPEVQFDFSNNITESRERIVNSRKKHLQLVIDNYFSCLLIDSVWKNEKITPPAYMYGFVGKPVPEKGDLREMENNTIYFEQIIEGKPSTFVGMVKRYIARAHDQGIDFTILDEMLQSDKNPIKINWNNGWELKGHLIQKSGLGWIDGHQIPGDKTKLTVFYPEDKPHLVRGWEWLYKILELDGFIEVGQTKDSGETQPDKEQVLPQKADAEESDSGRKMEFSNSKKSQSEYYDEEIPRTDLTETEKLCVRWAGRPRNITPYQTMTDFLNNYHNIGGAYLSRDQFKKALRSAGKSGLIIKDENARWTLPK